MGKGDRDNKSPAFVNTSLAAVKSLCDYYDVHVNWKRIKAQAPKNKTVSSDRPRSIEEIRKLLGVSDHRFKAATLIYASSGMRLEGLMKCRLRQVVPLNNGCARILVYEKSTEEYWTFVSPEAYRALQDYLEVRKKAGESISKETTLVRDSWDLEGKEKLDPSIPHEITTEGFASEFRRGWIRAGVRGIGSKTSYRHEFKTVHGFRKFFETQAARAISYQDVQILKGRIYSYYKPSLQYLEDQYAKAVPFLTISETIQVKQEVERKDKETTEQVRDLRLSLLEREHELNIIREELHLFRKDAEEWRNVIAKLKERNKL